MCQQAPEKDIYALIQRYDRTNDERITFKEFVNELLPKTRTMIMNKTPSHKRYMSNQFSNEALYA